MCSFSSVKHVLNKHPDATTEYINTHISNEAKVNKFFKFWTYSALNDNWNIIILVCISSGTLVSLLLISWTYRKYTRARFQTKVIFVGFLFLHHLGSSFVLLLDNDLICTTALRTQRFFRSSAVNVPEKKIVYQIIIRIITIFLYLNFIIQGAFLTPICMVWCLFVFLFIVSWLRRISGIQFHMAFVCSTPKEYWWECWVLSHHSH